MQRKINPEITRLDRIRAMIGSILALAGVFVVTFIGMLQGYSNDMVWVIGFGLIIFGVLLAGTSWIYKSIADLIRF